jgi:hypothetical protein
MTSSLRVHSLLLASVMLVACKGSPPRGIDPLPREQQSVAPASYPSALIKGVPHLLQEPDFCGEAAAAMYLRALGKSYDQRDVFNLSPMDPARGMGDTTRELAAALTRIGFRVGDVWHSARASHAAHDMDRRFAELHADLQRGVPSIVCMHYGPSAESSEHFRLVLGYDANDDAVIYHEPAERDGAYRRMPRAELLKLWPLRYRSDAWTVIRMRLDPGDIADPPAAVGHSSAELAQHVMKLKKKLPPGFSLLIEPPFVVVGDEPIEQLHARAESTVRWAVKMLKQEYFTRDPKNILDIWLLKDAASYDKYAREVFGDDPGTPYGYYSPKHRSLIMNISTGGGTLVHEIVHPFVESNFPDCPAWFNEGLGSLYEQSSGRDGRIVGLTNWRLAGLQRAIRRGGLTSFAALTASSDDAFYSDDRGTNYAQARYLLYYLQEKGLLRRYYQEYLAAKADDPSGYRTLQRILGERDMAAFQARWEEWVLTLSFP